MLTHQNALKLFGPLSHIRLKGQLHCWDPCQKRCSVFAERFLPALLILEVHHFLRHQTQSGQAIRQDLGMASWNDD